MRFRPGSWIAALALALALGAATPAAAQQSPTLGAPGQPDVTVAPQPTTSPSSDAGGLETWQQLLIVAAGVILLGGIAVAIIGDARERAGRLRGGPATEPSTAGHRHRQQSKQRARAKAKAAKAQRRKNR
jgi:hypothetical protein